ncbi:MAG: MBL fold metallo-hydrolase, partial [Pseudomonadota bacterium]
WEVTPGETPIDVDGERWPSIISMRRVDLADGVYLVRGVRTGFQHMVIDTSEGLVVGDAPAGWIEFHHLPPTDLAPGLGADGLSKLLIEFLEQESPGRPVHAVALTHLHDDHSGGARAFHHAGANVYAATELREFFDEAMGIETIGVDEESVIGGDANRAAVVSLGAGPHANSMLGLWAMDAGWFFVSDIHVPRDDSPTPRAGREATECWFAKWAVANLPEDTIVVNSHSPVETPVSRLREYLESPGCQRPLN